MYNVYEWDYLHIIHSNNAMSCFLAEQQSKPPGRWFVLHHVTSSSNGVSFIASKSKAAKQRSIPLTERKGSRQTSGECIFVGSVKPGGLLKCRMRHYLRLCLSSHCTPFFPYSSAVPYVLRSASLSLTHFHCLLFAQSVREWAQSIISLNCHGKPRKHNLHKRNNVYIHATQNTQKQRDRKRDY